MNNSNNNENEPRPPIGGADLECTLSYEDLEISDYRKMAEAILSNGFKICEGYPLFWACDEDRVDPLFGSEITTADQYFIQLKKIEWVATLINFEGKLFDIDVNLSISWEQKENVVEITTIENFIWEFGLDTSKADYNRLKAFVQICQAVCSVCPPLYARIATETTYADEFTVEKLRKGNSREIFNDAFYSESRMRKLYAWCINK